MEQSEFDNMMDSWLKQREHTAGAQSEKTLWAVKAGITDGARPKAFVTQEEVAQMLYRALEYFFRQIIRLMQEQ